MTQVATGRRGKEFFLAEIERRAAARAGEPEFLRRLRGAATERFAEIGFPSTTDEDWRFTNIAPIALGRFALLATHPVANRALEDAVQRFAYPGCARLVLLDGRVVAGLSDLAGLPAGVVVAGLAGTLTRAPEQLEPHLGQHADPRAGAFVALNTALFADGAVVLLPRGVVVERPIQLLFLASGTLVDGQPVAAFPRNLIVAGENSQATILETYGGATEHTSFTCGVTEVVAGDGSVLDHYKLQRESHAAFHVATQQMRLGRGTAFASHSLSLGGALVRHDVNAILAGEGADANLNGLYLVNGTQHVDTHMRVEHAKPHCSSHELYKGVLDGRSRGVFNGRIYVHKGAQKTDAKQTNRNLLLSKEALVNTNPQLEIFADDVKCTHGSTVGQLDAEAVFYLRSRGIGEEAARSLLTYAFASDIVERIKLEPLREELEAYLFAWLPKGEVVRDAV